MNVFITGSSKGIGKEIKDFFISNKHVVFGPSRKELNLSNLDEVKNYLLHFEHDIDILINNAGINDANNIENLSVEDLNHILDTNFNSHLLITQHFLKKFESKKSGRIVNISSVRTDIIKTGRLAYSLSKSSLHMLTKYVTLEFSKHNILCNTVSPGYVLSEMLTRNNSEEVIKSMLNSIPIQKFCHPKEIAKICYYLTVNNEYITGQNIAVDGGLTAL
jgi:NAD(P)-dependent dehydrogenase (short-subunit alcohol dehydrogenase family)